MLGQPVYTRAERAWLPLVCGLVLVLAPAPSSLALHTQHHHHPVDMGQWSVREPGDVRCYCNLPACITTGYMCKSSGPAAGCFSDLVDHVDVYRARHGCLDLLDGDRQRQCKNQPRPDPELVDDVPAWEQQDEHRTPSPSLLLCCTEDMCNHIDSPDSRMRHSGPNGSDASHVTMSGPAGLPLGQPGAAVSSGAAATSGAAAAAAAAARSAELWFKAATIAVPICGALILVLLIVLAVRLLRADSEHQRASKLSACAFPPISEKKLPLLPCGQGLGMGQGVNRLDGLPDKNKNRTLAKLNYAASYDLLDRDACHSHNRNMLGLAGLPMASKYGYKQVLASFLPWAGGTSGNSDPQANV